MAGDDNIRKRKDKWGRPRTSNRRDDKRQRKDDKKEGEGKESRVWGPREDNGEPREPRKPKRKVAVMIGYCGTGYCGMQINPPNKTIEEDLYKAFVEAGAISKDNANDLKKSGFMRAARTDKGVHAAGNVVSLKLIIEDPDIVEKINAHLPDQIRVWGISRTNKAFECRKMCSSRIYEYLIPSYSFLPPKPESALAERLEIANKKYPGAKRPDPEGEKFWSDIKKKLLGEGIVESDIKKAQKIAEDKEQEELQKAQQKILDARAKSEGKKDSAEATANAEKKAEEEAEDKIEETAEEKTEDNAETPEENASKLKFSEMVKKIKTAEHEARRAYRISPDRLELIREVLKQYEGVHNFHNFTISKTFKDPSAQRNMKSLTVSEGKIIENTEWLSIKIHGQSFMMHQIRKMIAMTALIVRCGTPVSHLKEAFGPADLNIPKAPGLGLLLEQPVYDAYNLRLGTFGYDPLNFEKWKDEVEAFKFKHIYDKIYSEEEREHVFHKFFSFIDSFRGDSTFGYLAVGPKDVGAEEEKSSNGIAAGVATGVAAGAAAVVASKFVMAGDDEDDEIPADADTEG